ncbi:MAG TPA: carboxypeptidase-like regulatory domain-containing protein [Ohtaekwangia sp.]
MLHKIISIGSVLLCSLIPVYGQVFVTGKVIDSDTKKPIADILVTIVNTGIETKTNHGGYFQLDMDTANHVVLSGAGYNSMEIKVHTSRFQVALKKTPPPAQKLSAADSTILMKSLYKNFIYPPDARKDKTQGYVYVAFQVDTTGVILTPQIFNDPNDTFSKSIISVFKKLPKLSPANTIRSFILPIRYRYEGSPALAIAQPEVTLPEGYIFEEFVIVGYGTVKY